MLYSKIEGEGLPLLILHGFLGMSDNWKSIASQLVENGFQVHVLDLRNHGRSFHSDAFNYELMAKDVNEYCIENKIEKFNLLGHSMGGKTAMLFATTFPEKLDSLIIADIGPKFYPQHHQEILAGLSAVDFSKKPSRVEVEETLMPYIPDFGTRQFLLKNLYWTEPGQLAFRFNLKALLNNSHEIGKPLPEATTFDKPTLFLRGQKSNYILDSDTVLIKKHFPNAEIKTINNAGHWLHAEKPTDFITAVLEFLKK